MTPVENMNLLLMAVSIAASLAVAWGVVIPFFTQEESEVELAAGSYERDYFSELEELDLDYRSGKLADTEYARQRELLMQAAAEKTDEHA